MLVSGMMSESETTSSFPDRLPEFSTAPSAPKLEQSKGNYYNTIEKKNSIFQSVTL